MIEKMIKTEEEYNEACKRVYELINSNQEPIDPNTLEGRKLEHLAFLMEKYEQEFI